MGVQSRSSDLLSAFHHATRSEDTTEALSDLITDSVRRTSALRGDAYLLDLSKTRLVLVFSTDPPAVTDKYVSLNPSLLQTADWRFRKAFQSRATTIGADVDRESHHHLLVPIVRERACFGVIRLVHNSGPFDDRDKASAQLVAELAAFIIERQHTLQLLGILEKRFDYQQTRDELLDELMLLAAEASRFPFIVLRELDQEQSTLECLRAFGFPNNTPTSLNLSPIANYPLFEAAIATRTTQIIAQDVAYSGSVITDVADREELQRVVIVPIVVGGSVFGTASFSVACDHNITTLEQRGLEAVSNYMGSVIANYRNVGLAHEVFFERAKAAAAFTTVDVAQAARHEARNFVHNAQTNLATISKMLGKTTLRSRLDVNSIVEDISNDLNRIDIELDKIKAITKPVDQAKEEYCVDRLWYEAIELVAGRLHAMNVKYLIRGRVAIYCIPDLLRHAFLQLILNSIDSFKDVGTRRGHAISVSIEEQGDKVTMKYTDNGAGVDLTKLMGRDFQGTPRVSDIFLPGVTTKTGGSGYGLYLVRRALDAHHGSIDLMDHRNGMAFKLSLPLRIN